MKKKDAEDLLKLLNAVREWRLADIHEATVIIGIHEGSMEKSKEVIAEKIRKLRIQADVYFSEDTTQ